MATASEEEDETRNAQAFTSLVPRLFGDRNTKCASSDRNCKPYQYSCWCPEGVRGPSADISRSSPNNVDNNISVSKTSNNSNSKNINDNSSENTVIDIVSIEASSSSSAEVEDSLDGFITVTRKNLRPKQASSRSVVPTAAIIAAELKKRSTPLLLFAVPKRKQSECCHRW